MLGSGTPVSNRDRSAGSSCRAEVRKIETPFIGFGDRVRIEMLDKAGASIFGAIEQKVVAAAARNAGFSADHVRVPAQRRTLAQGRPVERRIGDLAKAEERLEKLDDICFFGCGEYTDLKAAIEAYKSGKVSG